MSRINPVRRPTLPRSQPIRHFAGVFGGRPAPSDKTATTATRAGTTRKNGAAKKPGSDPRAGVASGVSAGYKVIEEYLRQGQDFARSLWPGSDAVGGGTAEAPMNMTERLIRSASDLAGLFSEFLQTFSMPGALPPPGSTPIPDFGIGTGQGTSAAKDAATRARSSGEPNRAAATVADAAASPRAAEAPAVISVDLHSRRRAEVTVNVRPGNWTGKLLVHDLRPAAGTARLTGVTASGISADRRIVVAVRVPDDQPAETYSGLIVDAETNLPRGTIAVRIFATAAAAPSKKPRQATRPPKSPGRRAARPAR